MDIAKLVDDRYEEMMSIALHHSYSYMDAEDAVQDAIVKLLRKTEFPPDNEVWPWFRRLLINTVHEVYRRKYGRHYTHKTVALSEYMHLFETQEIEWDIEYIVKAIDSLPDCFREVAKLNLIDGLMVQEIAEKLNIPLGTASTRIMRSKALLRDRIINGEFVPPNVEVRNVDIAVRVGISSSAVSKIMSGKYERFNDDTIAAVLQAADDIKRELGLNSAPAPVKIQ